MKVLGRKKVEDFKAKHAKSRSGMERFLTLLDSCQARTFVELKMMFPAVDQTNSGRTIFDVCGNNYRVISIVAYIEQQVIITHVLTHEEYSRYQW